MTLHSDNAAFRRFTKHYNETETYLLADGRALRLKMSLPHGAKWSKDIMHDIVMVAMLCRTPKDADQKSVATFDTGPLFTAVKRVKKHLEKARDELAYAEHRFLDALNWINLTGNNPEELLFTDEAGIRITKLIELADQFENRRPVRVHGGTGKPIPRRCIMELRAIFQKSTSKRPGTGKGPFATFVTCFWEELGYGRSVHAVIADIKATNRKP